MILRWRWGFALLSLAAVAGCDALSGPTSPALQGAGDLSESVVPHTPDPSRAVASMPATRQPLSQAKPVVVRGKETSPRTPPQTDAAADQGADVRLNFAGADIRDVVSTVLGETLKLNYVIDPDVTGPVSFNVSRPVSRAELLPTLEAVLNSRGATMVRVNGIIRVMLTAKAGKAGVGAPIGQSTGPRAVGQRTEVFPMKFVAPSQMQHVLEKVLPAGQVVSADDKAHMLTVQGSPTELSLAEETVRIFDVDQLSGTSMALIPLRNATPSAITDELRNIFGTKQSAGDGETIRFMAIDRLNAVMVLTRSAAYLDQARSWIARLDRAGDLNERRVYVYNLQYAKAAQVGQKLQGLLASMDIRFRAPSAKAAAGDGIGGDGDAKPEPISAKAEARKPPPPPPPEADPPPQQGGDSRYSVRIEADESHNALLISSTARDYNLIRQVLEGIDVPPLQVLIEVTVAEIALNDQLNYGVEYFINSGKTNTLLTTARSAAGITPSVPGFALSWVSGNFSPRAVLDLLSEVTQTRVISTPRLLVLSNQTARLQVGDVVPIITQSATSTVTSTPLVLNSVTYKETGVQLEVTPRVNAGGYVTLDVNQSVSDVLTTTSSQIDSPTFRQRRLTSTISVKNGETILLGGLIQQTDNRDSSGIPFLHDIPGIGSLFGNSNNSAARTELIMLMTPHVIANSEQSRDLTRAIEHQFRAVLDGSTLARPRVPAR